MDNEVATPAEIQALLSPAQDRELIAALSMRTGQPAFQVQRALEPRGTPNGAVEAALQQMLSDPDERMAIAAVEACIALQGRGRDLSAPVLSAGGPGAARALIVQAWVLPQSQAKALMLRELEGPRGRLAALELARLDPSPESEARILALKETAPPEDRVLLEYAARIAGDRLYEDLPKGGL